MHHSIFNDVLGPIMRGPSSSHTAGTYHIGVTAAALLGAAPARAVVTFDPAGSYARTFRQQSVDCALAAALLAWPLTDARFASALSIADRSGVQISFRTAPLPQADHPNYVRIELVDAAGRQRSVEAKSTGGGSFLVVRVDDCPVHLDGRSHVLLVWGKDLTPEALVAQLSPPVSPAAEPRCCVAGETSLVEIHTACRPSDDTLRSLQNVPGVRQVLAVPPVFAVPQGRPVFCSGAELAKLASANGWSLAEAGLRYETELLQISSEQAVHTMQRRWEIMLQSVAEGLDDRKVQLRLLRPSAGAVLRAEQHGAVSAGGLATRAAARAMAVMHTGNSRGVVCAAPTGGSAGVIPGVLATLREGRRLTDEQCVEMLFAAGAVGLIVANRATFAAEVAGCQVEIGVAGAMAAAAAVHAAGGNALEAMDAAAIALQNTLGWPCDLVQGMCEIPCHTRNAFAAAGALVCADLVLGGYENPIPLDETIDAALVVGKSLPAELRCTALGGLALAPSARRLGQRPASDERANNR